jgi:hypothetical protein
MASSNGGVMQHIHTSRTSQVKKLQGKLAQHGMTKKNGDKHKGREEKKNIQFTKQPKPTWLLKHLAPAKDTQTQMWKWKVYHWCSNETGGKCKGAWQVHKPSECKVEESKKYAREEDKKKETNAHKLHLQTSMQACIAQLQSALDSEADE